MRRSSLLGRWQDLRLQDGSQSANGFPLRSECRWHTNSPWRAQWLLPCMGAADPQRDLRMVAPRTRGSPQRQKYRCNGGFIADLLPPCRVGAIVLSKANLYANGIHFAVEI